ncbi:hypothetical protein [Vibrio metoecus]|uniref:Uncharacterized protein n=1 Tax=Vibrio metoecus TaxID=1481663 RepID=A0A271VU04_VIBMT|nr:hypothetical protein [Vibrio metoecus]KQB08210.1 hypothetical protein XV94_15245 [Vibrio metoecus]PAR21447.1 hypothetical protein CGU03_06990 [Vibrio metoecus]PAR26011.1 hypothetical protein CGU02_03110 [Vibrio metoecus]
MLQSLKLAFCAYLLVFSHSVSADDAELNHVAKKIKSQIEKSIKKSKAPLVGYCDVFIDLDYTQQAHAVVKKVSTLGDHELCKIAKRTIKQGNKYTYDVPERYIRIQITAR